MTHAVRIVAAVVVLTALALCVPVQAQTPEIDALRARAEAGVASAQNDLGFMYFLGGGVPEDDAEAVRWYRLAADQGLASAQNDLGVMYANGRGVLQDDAAAAPPRIFVNRCAPGSPGWPTALGDQPPDRSSAADPSGSVLRLCAGAVSVTQQL